jgi:hypothetical protein
MFFAAFLTTIDISKQLMGERAFFLLMERIRLGMDKPAEKVLINGTLIPRNSVRSIGQMNDRKLFSLPFHFLLSYAQFPTISRRYMRRARPMPKSRICGGKDRPCPHLRQQPPLPPGAVTSTMT